MATQQESQFELLKSRLPEASEDELRDVLSSAMYLILQKRYPFGEYPETIITVDGVETSVIQLENRYLDLQLRIAVELFNRIGVEGETSHTELGVQRVYSNGRLTPGLLEEVTPKVGIL